MYLDQSLQAYDVVLPAAGDVHTTVRIEVVRLADITAGNWVDVCQVPVAQAA